MKLYIPSRGRWRPEDIKRGPLPLLPSEWLTKTVVVVRYDELERYNQTLEKMVADCGLMLLSFDYDGIAEKRTLIGKYAHERGEPTFMMLDDDIRFLRRAGPAVSAQITMRDPSDIRSMFDAVEEALKTYPQVGLGLREVNTQDFVGPPPLLRECQKCIRAVAYQTSVFTSVDTNRVRTMSDYDTNLQILEKGLKNAVLWYWMSGQGSTQAAGGCSVWRTNEVHEQSVDQMVKMHPGLVQKRYKEAKGSGEFGKRAELTIYWKKAYARGVENARAQNTTEHTS